MAAVSSASRVDLRGTSVSVEGRRVSTEVPTVDPPKPVSIELGRSGRPGGESTNLAQVSIGSDSLTELKFGIGQLDSAVLPPTERSAVHARIQTVDPKFVGREAGDTGQTPVRIELSIPPDLAGRDALKATFGLGAGQRLDLFA